jgi:hypothetical protein
MVMCNESGGGGNKKCNGINGKEGRDMHAWGPLLGALRSARFGTCTAQRGTRWDGCVRIVAVCTSPRK